MNFLNKIWGIGLLAFMLMAASPAKTIAQDEYISDQDFYDGLSPYGIWVYDAQYGDVWVPNVDEDFRPYATRGHWVLTEYGNTWVSDYPWGWATFHYGRWRFDDFYGWEWIPGYEWAPAWVSWRQGGGYYGWAPLSPGISINFSFGGGYVPDDYWIFAPQTYINSPVIYNYYVPHSRVPSLIRRATYINNVYTHGGNRYIAGPRVQDIQRVTHRRPQVYRINNTNRPGSVNINNNTVNIYRPAVRRTADARPARVVDGNAYKQQNPNEKIARRGQGGAAAYNHENAARLANVAHSAAPNDNVVRVNTRPNNNQPGNHPDNNGQNRPGQNNDRQNNTPANRPGSRFGQPGNRPDNGQRRSARPEDRPNIAPRNNAQPATPAQPNPAQPGNRPGNGFRNRRPDGAQFNRPGQNDATAQQQEAQRQQQEQQRQQQQAQQAAQRQQMQRQQQDAQQQEVQRQQRSQQQEMIRQQRQQQQEAQQRQQQDAQRQQMQQQRQQQEAQRQQQQAQQQQRQQQNAQRQQQQQVQRQQQEQPHQQQERPQRQARPAREAAPQ